MRAVASAPQVTFDVLMQLRGPTCPDADDEEATLLNRVAIALSAFFASTGCFVTTDDIETHVDMLGLEAQGGPTGETGVNGASPAAFHANVSKLMAAMGVRASDPNNG